MDLASEQSRPNAMANIVKTLARLLDHGWIPLGELAYLIDVAPDTVYRKRADTLPVTIQVGGAIRIYHDDLITWLRKYPRGHAKTPHVDAVLALYRTMKSQRTDEYLHMEMDFMHDETYKRQKYQAILEDPDLTEEEEQWLRDMCF